MYSTLESRGGVNREREGLGEESHTHRRWRAPSTGRGLNGSSQLLEEDLAGDGLNFGT